MHTRQGAENIEGGPEPGLNDTPLHGGAWLGALFCRGKMFATHCGLSNEMLFISFGANS